jgi:hypothetical protein
MSTSYLKQQKLSLTHIILMYYKRSSLAAKIGKQKSKD